ncbi:DUF3822 family protein [Lacibacter luteus]|uniref:DUF3822 family protein n=1 Tax=Lacibacter luteus TaxID=2508719 RepID=A0A4Q1CET5_9BACT|nr:DUF3822 family protein [Lacibacter luteus]RXK58052.1 DUF3822 family protein [Lacibacter luteus]
MSTVLHPTVELSISNPEAVDTASAYLLVQVGNGFIGFASFQPTEKKVNAWVVYETALHELEEKLGAIAAKHDWVHSNYQKVLLVQYAANNVLVPAMLNSDAAKEPLLELVNGPSQNTVLARDIVLQQSLVNHYSIDATAAAILNKRFAKGEWWHVQSLLLTKRAAAEARITVTIRFSEVQLTAERAGKWLLLQSYSYQTPEDVLYYILNTMEQQQLSQEETTVLLQGYINQHSVLYDVLYNYILNLQLKEELAYSFPAKEEHPVHLSASLDQVLVCVS